MLSFKEKLAKNYINARGWSNKEKYVLIESDDWGAIRMPSKEAYDFFLSKNIEVNNNNFDRCDSLESATDLESLFEVLKKFKDTSGNHPVFTAYSVVGNPDFKSIEENNRKEYVFESVVETYKQYPQNGDVMASIRKGMKEGIYVPQYHGREHIHVKRWMEAINSTSEKEQIAFAQQAIISSEIKGSSIVYPHDYFKGFDFYSEDEKKEIKNIHLEGLKLFQELYQTQSISFMAQGSVFDDHILEGMSKMEVKLISGQQLVPNGLNNYMVVNKKWGQQNQFGQLIWRRNCLFEPGRSKEYDWVGKCIEDMKIAFRWGKPAVISAHRQNFIGGIFEENRSNSLNKLNILLQEILKKWPDVKFISTHDLAKKMLSDLIK
jgi:hypothetical protein